MNPRACHETELVIAAAKHKKKIAVVGGGMAGLAAATAAAERGHPVTLFEAANAIGGQFRMAAAIPGKEEFRETIRYYEKRLARTGVEVKLGTRVDRRDLEAGFDAIVVATGVVPRRPRIEGLDHPKVLSYADVLRDGKPVGQKVAVIGAGGIGVDVAEFLLHDTDPTTAEFQQAWGIDPEGGEARRPRRPGAQGAAPRDLAPAAQARDQAHGRRPWPHDGLGAPHRARARGRAPARRRRVPEGRRRRAPHPPRRATQRCSRSTTWSCAPGRSRCAIWCPSARTRATT